MEKLVTIIGGGLAGSECALTLASRGVRVRLHEMRPCVQTPVHHTSDLAELVCSNSLKSMRPDSAAGMLKAELDALGSSLYAFACRNKVPAGGALAVDRKAFSHEVTQAVDDAEEIEVIREEVVDLTILARSSDAIVLATGPLTSDALASQILSLTGRESLAFYDAAAPIVMADSLNVSRLFAQSRYEDVTNVQGDYLNAPFTKDEYEHFVDALVNAERVISKDFETCDLFQACQPIEEIARKGIDAPRFGAMKPVGLTDPATGRRPWAALQLRAEDREGQCFNLVGFQTNLTFPEQKRIFRMIPGLENAEFARYGTMHRNTFVDAPHVMNATGRLASKEASALPCPVYLAGQVSGTEGYCEAIRSGLNVAISVYCALRGIDPPVIPSQTVFGALMAYATDPQTTNYQPMHVNFGIMPSLERHIRNKRERYSAYAERGARALENYKSELARIGFYG